MRNSLIILLLLLCGIQASPQSYSFKNFNVEDGVSHPFIYDISQDEKGYLWIATGEGLSKFNGFTFQNYFTTHGLSENFISTLHRGRSGLLWIGHKQGGCTVLKDGKFEQLNTNQYFKSNISAIRGDDEKNTWLVSQHSGLIRVDQEMQLTHYAEPFKQVLLFDLQVTARGQMLLATNEGLHLYIQRDQNTAPEFIKIVDDIPLTKINCIYEGRLPGQYYVGTEDEGIYKIQVRNNNRVKVDPISCPLPLYQYNIQSVLEDSDKSLWVATFGDGLIHLSHPTDSGTYEITSKFDQENGLGSDDVKTVFRDRESNIWVGKFGGQHNAGGISSLSNNAFVFYKNPVSPDDGFYSIHGRKNTYWMGLKNAVMQVDSGLFKQPHIYGEKHGLERCQYTSVFVDDSMNVWAGSDQQGLFYKANSDTFFSKIELSKDRLSLAINDITGNQHFVWVATKNGIYEIERSTGSIHFYNKESGLEHNVVKSLFLDGRNNLWYCTASAYLSYIKNGKIVNIVISEDQRVHDQTGIATDAEGNIWLATNGSGVFIFDYESIQTINSQSHGLKSNFCYSIEVDKNNKVWIGHKGGISCYNPSNDQVRIIDQKDDMAYDFLPNAVYSDSHNELWFGTNRDLVRYNPSKDMRNKTAPIVNIESVIIDDVDYQTQTITLPYGHYRTRFSFLGLSLRKSDEVSYQYYLEGHDREWQQISNASQAHYSRLDPGNYTFHVVAFNADGIKSTSAATVEIEIAKPFWQQLWFIGLAALSGVVLLVTVIKMRDRRQRQIRQYLKKNLDIRTREVQAKSKELERKNKDITSSIHYAKKIQDATLPDQQLLRTHFPESFIFYKPRDIISGDFYWFRVLGNKLIVSVADCTGHGVPGALLSMIGSTKMDHIINRSEMLGPDDILRQLDKELRVVLQQTETSRGPQDGMDMVVVEIDLDTNRVRICSAMSHVFVASQNGVEKVAGDRNSIGGSNMGTTKKFTLHERQMQKGEALFLASDGYADQFGGENGKKLKRSGFVSLLEQLRNKPAMQQHEIVKDHFATWKGEHDQIDDVLLVGLQF